MMRIFCLAKLRRTLAQQPSLLLLLDHLKPFLLPNQANPFPADCDSRFFQLVKNLPVTKTRISR